MNCFCVSLVEKNQPGVQRWSSLAGGQCFTVRCFHVSKRGMHEIISDRLKTLESLESGILSQGCCPEASDRKLLLGGFLGFCGHGSGCCLGRVQEYLFCFMCYLILVFLCDVSFPILLQIAIKGLIQMSFDFSIWRRFSFIWVKGMRTLCNGCSRLWSLLSCM